ncbi:DUF7668 domain-containing protein [Spirillospora sp. CA-128828]|uniref:DUF7668 domain-containing protein n=1 Tax=Spirillospora sp. CA-128828 TaxID=3240033 RepID=UPI003D8E249F
MLPEEGVNAVRVVVALLVRGDYEELETLTEGRRLSASEMAAAVAGRGLISPPEEAFGEIEAIDVRQVSADERAFRVEFPLWTAREGRAGPVMRLTLTEVMDGVWTVELDGIGP